MELSLQTIFFLLVAFAVGAAIMLYMIGHWIDLSGFRYRMETQRNALNLLQTIVTNSPIVYKESGSEPEKLILNEARLSIYEKGNMDMYDGDSLTNNDWRKMWEDCCEFRDLDYKLTVIDLIDGVTWEIGELPLKMDDSIDPEGSDCYSKRVISYADMPVIIYRSDESHDPGLINITITKTILSDLSFWLSQASVRASWTSQDQFTETTEALVPIDPEIGKISIDKATGLVCVEIRREVGDPLNGRIMCKIFTTSNAAICDKTGNCNPPIEIDNPELELCNAISIITDPENERVRVEI